jgi:uncharacterized protein
LKNPTELPVPLEGDAITALVYRADHLETGAVLILAHGAGAGQRSPFMTTFAAALAARGLDVVTFNFPYTEHKRRVPDRPAVLEACFRKVIEAVRGEKGAQRQLALIGGKSMGGRIATQVAAKERDLPIAGIVLLGYPLHPPGRPTERRDAHLPAVGRPMLFIQGSRDAFGTPAELGPVLSSISPPATLHVVERGDHSFKIPKPGNQAAVYEEIQQTIAQWVGRLSR